jgi:inner membrane protein
VSQEIGLQWIKGNASMPTIFTHAVVPIAAAILLSRKQISAPLIVVGIVASMAPDADVVAFQLGIDYAHELGHRGASHSVVFALFLGLIAMAFRKPLKTGKLLAFSFVSVCAASHGFLDMFTNGGLGVAYYWPWSIERHFFAMRPIEVSPIGVSRFLSERGAKVILSELIWVWAPLLTLATIGSRLLKK